MAKRAYQERYKEFLTDKHSFFNSLTPQSSSFVEIERKAQDHNYTFLANNRLLIEQEFSQLYATLMQQNSNQEEFWFYCYYCCSLLKQCYQIYQHPAKVAQYDQLLKEIEQYCFNGYRTVLDTHQDNFFTALGKTLRDDLISLIDTPKRLSKLRDNVGFYNLLRIYWYFGRTTITKSLLLARDLKWLEKLGKNINVDEIIHILEKPNEILRFLSVGFFVTRLVMNAGMLLKHTVFCSQEERQLHWSKRFVNEGYKRHAVMLNDTIWSIVNGVTNYNELFGISNPLAGWILAGFLFVDISIILWRRHLERENYLTKRAQYLQEQDMIKDDATKHHHYVILTEQLKQLDLSWESSHSTYLFDATAAFLLASGFTASIIFTLPVVVLASYMVCTFAVGMYLSDESYKKYKEKSLILEQSEWHEGTEKKLAIKNYQQARNDFAFTLAKNTIVPVILIGTFAICWQAALVLTIAYIAYGVYRSHNHGCTKIEPQPEENIHDENPVPALTCR